MKKLLLAALALSSLNSFAQSYLVLNNGVVLTTSKAGEVKDLIWSFALPKDVSVAGGQFYVNQGKLVTINDEGFFYSSDVKVKSVDGKGMNYFITRDEITTINAKGIISKFKNKEFRDAERFGGKFFISNVDNKKKTADLFTVNDKGFYSKLSVQGLNPYNVVYLGGNYFFDNGIPYTVSNEGLVFAKNDFRISGIKMTGGNFFIDNKDTLYTISEEGFLYVAAVMPEGFKIVDVVKTGSNYMLDKDSQMFLVNAKGEVVANKLTTHDLTKAKILSSK